MEVPVEKVVIRAFGKEASYMRDLPLHHSQKVVSEGEGFTDFELTLRPTEDFFTPLLAKGAALKVLSPQWLADAICRLHREAVSLYE